MPHVDRVANADETALTAAGAVGLAAAAVAAGWAARSVPVDATFVAATASATVPALVALLKWPSRNGQAIAIIALWTAGAAVTCTLFGWATAPLILAPILAAVAAAGRTDLVAAFGFSLMAALAGFVAARYGVQPTGGPLAVAFTAASLVQVGALALAAAWRSRLREANALARSTLAEQRAAEASRLLSQKLASAEAEAAETRTIADSRARFLAEMSHELRTPLNAIIGFADAMRARLFGPLPQRYGEYADLIHRSGRHLLDLVGDVLDLSRIDAGRYEAHLERFDAAEAINDTLEVVAGAARESGVALIKPAMKSIPVLADRRAFRQMLLNLLGNAVKFTPSGGSVTVEPIVVGDILRTRIIDTGVGIPPEQLSDLGKPFQQATNQPKGARGVGLGLALVQRLAELHKGSLNIESRLGQGTVAILTLPIVVDETAVPSAAE